MKKIFLNLLYINTYLTLVGLVIVYDMFFLGKFGDTDFIFEPMMFCGLVSLVFSPVYFILFFRKETGKIVVSKYEAISITLGAIVAALVVVGILIGLGIGEGMSNIH